MRTFALSCMLIMLISTVFASENEDYVIGEEDMVQVSVWGNPDLNCHVPVKPGGMISVPLLGDVKAAGFTVQGLRASLEAAFSGFIKKPVVNVLVTSVNSFKVYILGSAVANQPSGEVALKKSTTLLQLLSQTSSFRGNPEGAYLLREGKKLNVDFVSLFKGDVSKDVPLRRGDLIYVPESVDRRIRVTGAVKAPSLIPYTEGMTALDAVISAGGFNEFANQNGVYIIRKQGDKTEKIRARLKDVVNGSGKNIMLMPGDLVNVNTGLF